MAICCFCGHGDVSDAIRPALARLIEEHIKFFGITEFWVGNYGRFDRMARSLVCSTKKNYHEVRLCLLLPYLPTGHGILPQLVLQHRRLEDLVEHVVVLAQ